jgi:hypothetical protein
VSQKQTAQKAVDILCSKGIGFRNLSGIERTNLAAAFARENKVVYGKAFDLIRCMKKLDLTNEMEIRNNLNSITVYEVKSTNRKNMPDNFEGYFFDLTTAELLVAQSLGNQYKFAFINTETGKFMELTINEVYARAKKIYPKWAITLGSVKSKK